MQKGENPETDKKIVDFAHMTVLYYKCWGSRKAVFFAAKNKKPLWAGRGRGAELRQPGSGAARRSRSAKSAKKELTLDSVSLHSAKGQFSEFLLSNIV